MRKVIAAFNMSLDGICDHTVGTPDEEVHQHYTDLLKGGDVIVYGRTTYQLMESYWPKLVENPSGNKRYDDFAQAIQNITKVLFSRTVKKVEWENAHLATRSLKEEVEALKQQAGKDILIGSCSMIIEALNLGLIDEFHICVYPVIQGKGLELFDKINDRIEMKLLKTKTFSGCGAVMHYYEIKK